MPMPNRHPRWHSTTVLLAAGLGLVFAACSGSGPNQGEAVPPAEAKTSVGGADEMGLITAHKNLVKALESGDVAALTALVDPSPDLLIFHPFINNRFDGIGEVDEGLSRMFEELGAVSWSEAHTAYHLEGNAGWITSQVVLKSAALPGPFVGRGTEIWVHGPNGWRLNHAHWSESAEVAGSMRDEG